MPPRELPGGAPREDKPRQQAPETGRPVDSLGSECQPGADTVPGAVNVSVGGTAPPSFNLLCEDVSSKLLGPAPTRATRSQCSQLSATRTNTPCTPGGSRNLGSQS